MMKGKIEGNFRVFKHVNNGYSLAVSIDDKNEEFFSELGQKIATLACENKGKTTKLKSLKPSDLELRQVPVVSIRMYTPAFT